MTDVSRETIFALSSGAGKAGVAIIRIAGPLVNKLFNYLISGALPKARFAAYRDIIDFQNHEIIDQALILYFKGPESFTGTDVIEIQCHGSRAIVSRILELLSSIEGFRHSEAGEFTRLAYDNGKLDLTQVEGLADLIAAETEAQRKLAQRLASGYLSKACEIWRKDLIKAAAMITAVIDFSDEEIPDDAAALGLTPIENVIQGIQNEISSSNHNQKIINGFNVVILGKPNAGKSTLLNALTGQDTAIVSDIAGTTRDAIEARLDISGVMVTLVDTAGLRESYDVIEQEGISRALKHADNADAQIILSSADSLETYIWPDFDGPKLYVTNKADLSEGLKDSVCISAKYNIGIHQITDWLKTCIESFANTTTGSISRIRQMDALKNALIELNTAKEMLEMGDYELDLISEHLQIALRSLQSLLGYCDVEEILGAVFSEFCVGK